MPDLDAKFAGRVTEALAHQHQEITLEYAHNPPTNGDIQTMIGMLRRQADDYEKALLETVFTKKD